MVLKLGLMCSNDVPVTRPSMRQVVRYLDGEVEVPEDLKKPGDISHHEGFDEFLHSLASSSFDKMSSGSNFGNRDMESWVKGCVCWLEGSSGFMRRMWKKASMPSVKSSV